MPEGDKVNGRVDGLVLEGGLGAVLAHAGEAERVKHVVSGHDVDSSERLRRRHGH